MSDSRVRSLRAERKRLLGELAELSGLIHGSYFERYSTCSRPGCACHEGKRHGPRSYVSRAAGGKPKQHYVPKGQAKAAREGVEQHRRMLQIADRVTEINLELMRGGRLDESG